MPIFTNTYFPHAEITHLNDEFCMVDYPAFSYMHAKKSDEKPISVDKGGRHLGKAEPGIAVPFPTRRHGWQHKHFGIGTYTEDDTHGNKAGDVFAYGKGVSLTSDRRAKEYLVAAFIGDTVLYEGRRYIIERRPNDNIALVPAE